MSPSGVTPSASNQGTLYTGAAARGTLITARAVTDKKKADDLKAAAKFVAVSTSPKARQKDLVENKFAGVYVIPRLGAVKPIYVLSTGHLAVANGASEKRFIAQGVNDSSRIQPEAVPLDISGMVAILLKTPDEVPELWKPNFGRPFKKAEVATTAPALYALLSEIDDDESVSILVSPKALGIRYGVSEVHRGAIDDVGGDLLEENLPGSSFWPVWMAEWKQPIHDAVVDLHSRDPKILGDIMPKFRKFQDFYANSALTITENLYQDDIEVAPHIEALRKRLFDAAPPPDHPPSNVDVSTAPSVQADNSKAPSVASSKTYSTAIPKKLTLAKFTDEEAQAMKFRIMHLGFDPNTKQVAIPELTEDMAHLFSMTNARQRNDYLADILNSYAESVDNSNDFLQRQVDFPDMNTATRAIYINSKVPTKPMVDMDGSKERFRTYMITPDNKFTLELRENNRDDRGLEELCGEEGTNLSKVNTAIVFNQMILSFYPFMAFLANRCGIIEACVKVDSENWDDPANSCLYRFLRALAYVLTESSTRRFFKTCPQDEKADIFGWLLQMIDSYECLVNHVPSLTNNVIMALHEHDSKIKTTSVIQAENMKVEVLKKLVRITNNTDTVPHCSLNLALKAKAEAAASKRKRDPDTGPKVTPPEKRGRKTDVQHDKSGPLQFPMDKSMPIVNEPDISKRLCTPTIRKGKFCTRGDRCNLSHEKDPDKWPIATLKAYCELVDKTDDLTWDSSVDVEHLKKKVSAYSTPAPSK